MLGSIVTGKSIFTCRLQWQIEVNMISQTITSLRNDTCLETMIYLNDALDTFIESKVGLVCMRYFQWYTTIFKVQTTIIT